MPIGAYADVRLMSADRLVPLPPTIPNSLAAAIFTKGITAHYLIFTTFAVKAGDAILVHAAAAAAAFLSHDGALLIRDHRMFDFPRLDWLEVFRDRVNADPEMKLVGEFFTTSIALTFGETRYVLRVENGRINAIVPNPRIDVRAAFGFRAPLEVGSKFLSPPPRPL